jgi:hypothetical protein
MDQQVGYVKVMSCMFCSAQHLVWAGGASAEREPLIGLDSDAGAKPVGLAVNGRLCCSNCTGKLGKVTPTAEVPVAV